MTSIANGGNAHALVREDENRARELAEGVQGTSPTPRSAAYHSDVELAGRSQAFVEAMKQVDLVSGADSPVLLTGEPGTGQELVAAAIHHRSHRSDRPFLIINCAAIPAELIDVKLFGQEDRKGLFEEADGGTVFLDEVTQASPSLQLNLMRLVQTGELNRVASTETQKVNVRVIAASSCDLELEVAAERFSKDLFNVLSAVWIALPSPPDHQEDIAPETSVQAEHADDDLVTLSTIEGRHVARVLEHTRGNKQAAARILSVDRKTLDRMIKRHNIDCHHRAKAKTNGHKAQN
ncbi:MAG TPA: sigma-54-dependent Fis family transcriptional regulator [Pyrinomonadaceae bacterium]|nr:sigma-54-dependent Fis family transcriptional regulator [Pyrinomonadaceae bacterium]